MRHVVLSISVSYPFIKFSCNFIVNGTEIIEGTMWTVSKGDNDLLTLNKIFGFDK